MLPVNALILLLRKKNSITMVNNNHNNMSTITSMNFLILGTEYYVSGLQENYPTTNIKSTNIRIGEIVPIVSFSDCSKLISDYVRTKASPPEELPLKTIFAFSYYFDRATEVGLIGESVAVMPNVKIIVCKHL